MYFWSFFMQQALKSAKINIWFDFFDSNTSSCHMLFAMVVEEKYPYIDFSSALQWFVCPEGHVTICNFKLS